MGYIQWTNRTWAQPIEGTRFCKDEYESISRTKGIRFHTEGVYWIPSTVYAGEKAYRTDFSWWNFRTTRTHTHTQKKLTVATMETENTTYKASKIRILRTSPQQTRIARQTSSQREWFQNKASIRPKPRIRIFSDYEDFKSYIFCFPPASCWRRCFIKKKKKE